MRTFDAAVVGGGPAGLAAATWLARYRRHVVVLDGREYRNRWVEKTHGYLAFDGASPHALIGRARDDLERYRWGEILETEVRSATRDGDRFVLATDRGDVEASRIVLATGVRDAFPEVEGFVEHYGVSVFHCPACDGYDARGRDVVVLGWGEQVAAFALGLLDWAASVTVLTEGREYEGDGNDIAGLDRHGISLLEDDAVAFVGERGDLRAVTCRSGAVMPCQLAFFSIAHHPRTELAVALGCRLTDEGCIAVDDEGRTSVDGVYAAGDVVPGLQLIQVAAGEGVRAGVACALSLRGTRTPSAAPEPAPDPERELA